MLIKICGLRTPEDVAAAVDAGAHAVGFVFVDSPRKVTLAQALTACADLSDDTLRVAVMKAPTQSLVNEVIAGFNPDILQTDAEDFATLEVPHDLRRWPVYRQGVSEPEPDTIPASPMSDDLPVFLYEGASSGSGEPIDWAIARQHAGVGHMLLAGGLNPENVGDAIAQAQPWGVDVSSGVESSRGTKDHQKIYAFVKAAQAATRST